METRAARRRRMKRERTQFVTRYKFLEECGCGLNIEADSTEQAVESMLADYVAHGHNAGKPFVRLAFLERPGITIGKVVLDFVEGKATYEPGGPPFPCGTGWDYVCYGCGTRCHTESQPVEHPELLKENGGDPVQICDPCWEKLQAAL